jgi:hypothetical protein
MRSYRPTQREEDTCRGNSTLAKALAPEEIRRGDFVTLLSVTYEVPSYFWDADASTLPRDEPVRIRFVPECGGVPLKVQSVCLPFVLVKVPAGDRSTIDVRRCRLARLDRTYAARSWKAYKKALSKSGKK